jgi:chlorobactene glucosyltransferase
MIGALALPALVPLAISAVNLLTWPRARRRAPIPRVSALVPARNEEGTIRACVTALLAEPFHEVIVLDDHSTDRTPEILASIQDPRLRVLSGRPLPAGWVGKPNACAQLGAAATGEVLVFVDADVRFSPGGLERLAATLVGRQVVSALPEQRTGSAIEALIIAQLHLTYASWLPLRLIALIPDPRILAANGQVLAVRADAYRRIGGFEAVHAEVVDDMAFCAAAKRVGCVVDFVDGAEISTCRMYTSDQAAIDGFTKNLYEGIGGTPLALIGVMGLHLLCFGLPWLLCLWAPLSPWAWLGVAANLTQRALLARRFGHPWWTVPAHPLGIALLLGIAVRSWRRNEQIQWRGRTYVARARRTA